MSIDKLDPALQALLDAERTTPGPAASARDRVRQRLGATLAIGMGGTPAPGQPTPTPVAAVGRAASSLGWLRVVALVTVAGGAGVGSLPLLPRQHATSDGERARDRPQRTSGDRSQRAASDRAGPCPACACGRDRRAAAGRQRREARRAGQQPRPRLAQSHAAAQPQHRGGRPERRPLRRAHAPRGGALTLAAGRTSEAIGAVSRHARQFSRGQLVEERESLWVRAQAKAGDREGAISRGTRFTHRYPHSIFLPAVQATLDSLR